MNHFDVTLPATVRTGDTRSGSSDAHAADQATAGDAFNAVLRDVTRGPARDKKETASDEATEETGGEAGKSGATGASGGKRAARAAAEQIEAGTDDAAAVTVAASVEAEANAARLLLAELGGAATAPESTDDGDGERTADAAAPAANAEETAKARSVKVTVVARETHFEPVRRPGSIDRLATEATTAGADAEAVATSGVPTEGTSKDGVPTDGVAPSTAAAPPGDPASVGLPGVGNGPRPASNAAEAPLGSAVGPTEEQARTGRPAAGEVDPSPAGGTAARDAAAPAGATTDASVPEPALATPPDDGQPGDRTALGDGAAAIVHDDAGAAEEAAVAAGGAAEAAAVAADGTAEAVAVAAGGAAEATAVAATGSAAADAGRTDDTADAVAAQRPTAAVAGDAQAAGGDAGRSGTGGSMTGNQDGPGQTSATAAASGTTAGGSAAALPTLTLQRLAGAILTEAQSAATGAARTSASADGEQAPSSGGPVKILTIRLQPDHLGTVTVRMRLVGNALEMQFRVSNSDTAELLKRDRQALAEILKSSGYDTDLLTIQTSGDGVRATIATDPSSSSSQAGARQEGQSQGQAQGGFRDGAGEQASGQRERGGEQARREGAPYSGVERHDETLAESGRSGDLYV